MNDKTEQSLADALRCTAAGGRAEIINVPGYPLMVRAVGYNTLRDYFAAQAIGPLLQQIETYPDENWRLGLAIDAYAMADAMLAARERAPT